MARSKYLTAPPEQTTMPGGVPYIVGNEAAERFSFYGMKTVLAIFMTKYLQTATGVSDVMPVSEATKWVHQFDAAAYFFPFFGAILADWLFGKYPIILWLSMFYCLGHGVLAMMDSHLRVDQRTLLFWGLTLIAMGAGGIKSCVSAHVGDQFGKKNQHLLSVVFSWFYFSINLGATVSTLLTPWVAKQYGYKWAFGIPGILMAVATFVFWLGRNKFVHIPPARERFFRETFSQEGLSALWRLFPLYLFVAMFWALFDQTGSRWVIQAAQMDRQLGIFNFTPTPDQFQAANPILILILIPIFSYLVYPLMQRFFAVTPLRKVGIGLFMMLPAFIVPAWIEARIVAGETPHIGWQLLAYVFLTVAEVMVSITALEFSYTQSPNQMKSLMMGVFWLSVSLGNEFTAVANWIIEKSEKTGSPILQGPSYYWFFTGCMAVTAMLYVIWAPFYHGRTYIQESQPESPAEMNSTREA